MNNGAVQNDIRQFRQEYERRLNAQTRLPEALAAKYRLLSLLAETPRSQVFLIAERDTETKRVLKITPLREENAKEPLLRSLHDPDIPVLIEQYTTQTHAYLVREYVPGENLAALVQDRGPMSRARTLAIATRLCDVLIYLHTRPAPVICRDVKPENVILTADGGVKLIDFDISREYDAAAKTDTEYFGTRAFSPPEQYGFSQTDARTDLYALGMLMLFLLTGAADRERLNDVEDRRVRAIVEKCTAFAPKDRYPDAKALKRALIAAQKPRVRLRARTLALLLAGALALGAALGIWLGNRGETNAVWATGEKQTAFASALVERAVRLTLGKDENEPIYADELATVTCLQICGDQVYDGSQKLVLSYMPGFTNVTVHRGGLDAPGEEVTRGDLTTLEDVTLLPALRSLTVMMQHIDDLSPLVGLPLEQLNVAGNGIGDLSPLAALPDLTSLTLDGNPVSDLSALASLGSLQVLSACDTLVRDLTPLAGCLKLNYLYLNDARVCDVTPLADLPLIDCFLKNNEITDFSPLSQVENLETE